MYSLSPKKPSNPYLPRLDLKQRRMTMTKSIYDSGPLSPFKFPTSPSPKKSHQPSQSISYPKTPKSPAPRDSRVFTEPTPELEPETPTSGYCFFQTSELNKLLNPIKSKPMNPKEIIRKVRHSYLKHISEEELKKLESLKHENVLRRKHIDNLLKIFINEKTAKAHNPFFDLDRSKILPLSEKILTLYDITPMVLFSTRLDTNMKITHIGEPKTVAHTYEEIIPELCKFPYSFVKKLGITNFQFCDSFQIFKYSNIEVINKRIYQGLIPTKDPREAKKHFYKLVLFGIKRYYPDFDMTWVKIVEDPGSSDSELSSVRDETCCSDDHYEEQAVIMMDFMRAPLDYLYSRDRIKKQIGELFRAFFELTDNVGIDGYFWYSLGVENNSIDYISSTQSL